MIDFYGLDARLDLTVQAPRVSASFQSVGVFKVGPGRTCPSVRIAALNETRSCGEARAHNMFSFDTARSTPRLQPSFRVTD